MHLHTPTVSTPHLSLFVQLSRLPRGLPIGQPDSRQILHHSQQLPFQLKFNKLAWNLHTGISVWRVRCQRACLVFDYSLCPQRNSGPQRGLDAI